MGRIIETYTRGEYKNPIYEVALMCSIEANPLY